MSNIHFNQDLSSQFKMIEVSEELAQQILKDDKILIKGNASSAAVLCTDTTTYEMKQVDSSNMLILISSPLKPSALPSEATAMAIMKSHIELTLIKPDFSQLRELLKKHTISDEKSMKKNGVTLDELSKKMQSSRSELKEALKLFGAIHHDGYWVCLHNDFEFQILDELVTIIRAKGFQFEKVPKKEVRKELLESFCDSIVDHIMSQYFTQSNLADMNEDDLFLSFKVSSFSLFVACRILQMKERYTLNDFEKLWKKDLSDIDTDMNLIKGLALVDKNGISWFPHYLLPKEPEKRFMALFNRQTTWTHQQIIPYLEDLGIPKDQLLIKWTLCTQKGESKLYSQKK